MWSNASKWGFGANLLGMGLNAFGQHRQEKANNQAMEDAQAAMDQYNMDMDAYNNAQAQAAHGAAMAEWQAQRDRELAMLKDALPMQVNKYDKFADNASFIPRSWGWVDPQREMQANIQGLQNGIVTYQDVQANYGRDVEELFEQHDRESKLADQYDIKTAFQPFGLKTPTDPIVEGAPDAEAD